MGDKAGDVALAAADPGDIACRRVVIGGVVGFSFWVRLAKDDLMIFFQRGEHSIVTSVISVVVRDGNFENLALLRSRREWRVRLLDANVNVAADIAQAAIAHHGAGEQAGFAENLEAVANAQDHAAALGEFLDGLHHWRKTRDGASAEIVAIRKSAGQNDGIAIREILGLMPDKFDGLLQDVPDAVKSVMVAIV